jgi:hypothetical protein
MKRSRRSPFFPWMDADHLDDVTKLLWKITRGYPIGTQAAAFAPAR